MITASENKILNKLFLCFFVLAILCTFLTACSSSEDTTSEQAPILITTDITDGATVYEKSFRFIASATYDDAVCNIRVNCNGILLQESEGGYIASLRLGENVIEISASHESERKTKVYKITYSLPAETPSEKDEIAITTDLIDGAIVPDKALTFRASAAYRSENCDILVSCNGIFLNESDGEYTASLRLGENVIEISAAAAGKSEIRQYKLVYRADFAFFGDPDRALIRNDVITFSLRATFNDTPCAILVTCNDAPLSPGEDGSYTAYLKQGANKITGVARFGDHIATEEWNIDYGTFTLSTDLSDSTSDNPDLSFRAVAQYKTSLCTMVVLCNGEEIVPVANKYSVTLHEGENIILLRAVGDGAEKQYSYTVKYVNSPPTLSVGITDSRVYRGSIYSFDVTARDGIGQKLAADCISFSIDKNASDGVDRFVSCEDVSLVWDDSTMTSFRIYFNRGVFASLANQSFVLRITATDSAGRQTSLSYTMTYLPAKAGESIGEVTFTMEGFSVGCGYFIEPVHLPVYEGVPFSRTLTDLITSLGYTYTSTGLIEKGFYLASVTGLPLEGNRIVDGIWEVVKDRGYVRSIKAGGSLGEFDFGSGSGWMYSVNGVYKNFGFSDYYPQDGDVVRVQFTVLLGEDLGGGGALGGGATGSMLDDNPDYAPILKILADIAETSADKTVYYEVLDAISEWNIPTSVMEEQLKKIKEYYGVIS